MKSWLCLTLAVLILVAGRAVPAEAEGAADEAGQDLAWLRQAYPDQIQGVEREPDGRARVVMADGARIVYDDGMEKDFRTTLDHPDLQDTMAQVYPLGPTGLDPQPGFDPGRFRNLDFLKSLYGATRNDVLHNCVTVRFAGHPVQFNARCGAAEALQRVSDGLAELLRRRPDLAAWVLPLGGTFSWRPVAGTSRLSMHAFAAAIDLNPHAPYWRSAGQDKAAQVRRSFPPEIVELFEKQGFIWGGKWHEFDLMHFEYRPELILKSRSLGLAPAP